MPPKICAGAGLITLSVAIAAIASGAPPRATLTHLVCRRALAPISRKVAVTALMRPVPGTATMEVQFDLLRRSKTARRFASVRAGDLGQWISPSDPTLGSRPGDVWEPTHDVVNLAAPAAYRFRVRFRWSGAGGHLLARAVRLSGTCFQPELRPDLVAVSLVIDPDPTDTSQDRYVATLRNSGASGAGPFDLQLGGAGPTLTRNVKWLRRYSKPMKVVFHGPACLNGDPITLSVDPGHEVADDYDTANNALTVPCP